MTARALIGIADATALPRYGRALLDRLGARLLGTAERLRALCAAALTRVRSITPAHLFWAALVVLLLVYVLVLVIQPTSAGRGGR